MIKDIITVDRQLLTTTHIFTHFLSTYISIKLAADEKIKRKSLADYNNLVDYNNLASISTALLVEAKN